MKSMFVYTLNLWYFWGAESNKEFMQRTVIAEDDENAKKEGKKLRRNIFSIDIIKKEPYDGDKI